MRRLTILIFFILLSCSKDAPIPDAVVPTPTVKFTLAVAASEGGSVNDPGDTHNENTNVSLTATPDEGYTFSGWTGDASGSTNPLSVSMTQNKNITANFIRTKYLLNIGTIGEGDVTQEVISTAKTSDEYNSGTLVRLSAAPSENWLFYAWNDGSTGFIDAATGLEEAEELNFTNPREISIDRSLNVTATFERIIEEEDNPTNGVGRWKIKKPKSANKTGKAAANKTALVECGLSEIIFRTDGSFTIVTSTATFSGQYNFDGNTTIILTQVQEPFGTITNLLISNGSISFSISLVDGCSNNAEGYRDETYVESEDPITSANCTISSSLDNGSESQTISQTNSIQDIVYSFSTTCTGSLSASADNLPPGVTMNFSDNQAILSGAPSSSASGTYDYTIVVTAPNIATSVSGQISVVGSEITSCTISGQNIGGGQSQTVTLTNAISDITFSVNSSCEENLQAEAFGLPTGVIMSFSDNTAIISGTPTGQTGNYPYDVNWYSSTSTFTLGGTITVVAGSTTSTSTTSSSTADTTAPTITLVGSSTINLTVGDTFTDPGAAATDDVDGDITSSITTSGTVNTSTVGEYTIVYSVSDAAGNTATVVQRTVIVSAATNSSNCTINGQNVGGGQSQTVTLTNAISDITFSVNSSCEENLQAEAFGLPIGVIMSFSDNTAIISGTPTGQTGNYPYDVNWYSSTSTFTLGGTITVVAGSTTSTSTTSSSTADTTAPTITLVGSSTINLTVGDTFTDPGATATDDVDGDLTSSIVVDGTVDSSNTETYTLTYSVSDAASNLASATRYVIVSAVASNSGNISFVNGTCQCPNATVGDTAVIGGVTYTAVDNNSIAGQIANSNVNLCTTLVTDMDSLFVNNTSFNTDISFWDISNVTGMTDMFNGATSFNQDISSWSLSSMMSLSHMFFNAASFNQDISSWDISNVIFIDNLFNGATAFNQDIGGWNTSNVTGMSGVFANGNFNQDIGNWDTSNVTNMSSMFFGSSEFNGDISSWDTSSVTDMSNMFRAAQAFNQNIGNWDTSNVTDMTEMLRNADEFNQNINAWNVSAVSNMSGLFRGTSVFNQSLSNWNVSSVTVMDDMFNTVLAFNQDLTGWCVSGISSEPFNFASNSALTEANKPLWGKEFTVALTTGSNSQTVTATNAITDIKYTATPICAGSISASVSGLPSGVTLAFGNNVATISGSANATGTFAYALTFTGASTSQAVTGTITFNAAVSNLGNISFVNGTCSCPNATAGDTAVIDGITYTAVDNSTIGGQVNSGNINLCTTLVTNMQNLFSGKANFNSDIGFWDTSNVTNMDRLFENASSFNQDISGWCVSNINSEPLNFLFNSALTEANKPIWGTCPDYIINVTASSNSDYTLSGSDRNGRVTGNDPSITINVGDEINFIVDAASHPFYIKTAQGTGTDNQATDINSSYPNGAISGAVNWTPTTAGTYYYQCSVHNGMYGTITVQ